MSYHEPMRVWPAIKPFAKEIILNLHGLRLHIYDTGPQNAPVLFLVHGLGDESDTWRHIIQPLAVHQRVIAADLPGFGRSQPLQRYTIDNIIEVLLDLLDTLKVKHAIFIGSSLGGLLSHTIAILHPDRVQGLVLLDGHLAADQQKIDLGTLLFLVPGIGEWRYNRYRKDPQAAYDSLQPFYANLDNLPTADREFLFQRVNQRVWSNQQRQAYLGVLRNTAAWMVQQQRHLEDGIKHLAIPTLVLYGEQDKIMPPENAQVLSKLQPSAQVIILPEVGHLPQQEAPDKVLTCLQNHSGLGIKL